MKLRSMTLAALLAFPSLAFPAIKSEPISYKDGDTQLKGYLVYDDAITEKRPAVVVYPEWWGLTDYPQHRAEMLVKLGYVAFAADMYGADVTTTDPKKAGELATPIKSDRQVMRRRAMLAIDEVRKSDHVDGKKIAAIGYCFGGTCVLELARMGADVKGVVSFHGGLDSKTTSEEGSIKPKILVCAGGADAMVPDEQIKDFVDEMRGAKANWQINVYHDAQHAFTNPKADSFNIPGIAYNKQADNRSWTAMRAFLTELFGRMPTTTPNAK